MTANGDDPHAGKWTDETLSMRQRHELLVQELERLAPKPHANAGRQEHTASDAPSASDTQEKHAG